MDSNKVTPPTVVNRDDTIPQLPKSESITLKNNLKSVINNIIMNIVLVVVVNKTYIVLFLSFQALNGLSRININSKKTNFFVKNEIMSTTQPSIESINNEEKNKRKVEKMQSSSSDTNEDNNTNIEKEIR